MLRKLFIAFIAVIAILLGGCQFIEQQRDYRPSPTPCDVDGCIQSTSTPLPNDWPTPTLNQDQIYLTQLALTPTIAVTIDPTHYYEDSGTPYNPDRQTLTVTATLNPDQINLTQLALTPTNTVDLDDRATHYALEKTLEATP